MDTKQLAEQLLQAQKLLADVHHFACQTGRQDIERAMERADSCIDQAYLALLRPGSQ